MKCKICERKTKNKYLKFCSICSRNVEKIPAVFIDNLKLENDLVTDSSYYLHGPAGVGKSQKAANMLVTRGGGKWANIPKLLHNIRSSFDIKLPPGEYPIDYVTQLSEIPWLCLDDLGVESTTDWVFQTLYVIINNRYENLLPTVITSNLSLNQLSEKMEDGRLASRIAGMCEVIEMEGEDKRIVK